MNQSDLNQSRNTEKLIFLAGFLLLVVPGALLFTNVRIMDRLFHSADILALSPIGEITRPNRIVRRRGEDDLAFSTIRSGESVFVGDTIITGKGSSTRVNLRDGSILEVGPESMIKIAPVRSFSFKGIQKKFNVTVQAGEIKAKIEDTSSPIIFKSITGSILTELKPAPATEKPTEIGPRLETPIPAPEFAVVTAPRPTDLPKSEETPVPAPAPPVPSVLSEAPSAPTSLPPMTQELMQQPSTGKMISDFLSALNPTESEIRKDTSPPSASEDEPILSRFNAPLQPIPDLEVDPLPATSILSDEADLKDHQFTFKWKDAGFRVKLPYLLKVQYQSQIQSFETPETQYRWPLPLEAEGTIKWWVEAALMDGTKIESKKQDASWKLPTPVLASPGNNLELPEFYLKGESHEVLLTWKQMRICKFFELQVSKTQDFRVVEFKKETAKNFQTFPVMKPGKYYWRVACAYTKEFRAFSEPFRFTLSRLNQ